MKTPNSELELYDDSGPVLLYGDHLNGDKAEVIEPRLTSSAADFINNVRERFTLDFLRHPKRDVLATALALSGLGFATGATIAARKS